jgi:hypothetical protein
VWRSKLQQDVAHFIRTISLRRISLFVYQQEILFFREIPNDFFLPRDKHTRFLLVRSQTYLRMECIISHIFPKVRKYLLVSLHVRNKFQAKCVTQSKENKHFESSNAQCLQQRNMNQNCCISLLSL